MILLGFLQVFISPFSPFDRLRIYSKHLRYLQTRQDWSKNGYIAKCYACCQLSSRCLEM